MEPFWREDDGDEAGGAGDGGGEKAGAEEGTVDKEEELVGGFAAINMAVEGDGEDAFVDAGRGDFHALHRAATDDGVWSYQNCCGGPAAVRFAGLPQRLAWSAYIAARDRNSVYLCLFCR